MTSDCLTLTKGQGHTTRSKVTDVEVFEFSECFLLVDCFNMLQDDPPCDEGKCYTNTQACDGVVTCRDGQDETLGCRDVSVEDTDIHYLQHR